MPRSPDCYALVRRLLRGDRLARFEFARLVTGLLVRWNAYDLRDEWDDLIQEVAVAVTGALRDGRLGPDDALYPYIRTVARNIFADHLRTYLKHRDGMRCTWESVAGDDPTGPEPTFARARDVHDALSRLPDKMRAVVAQVYLEGFTYEEAAQATGIPLGTLKRLLREGLAQLRDDLSDSAEDRDPIRAARRIPSPRKAGVAPAGPPTAWRTRG